MAVIDEGKVNKQVDTGETQETSVFKTVVGSDKEYDGTANSEDYGPNPGLTVSEDTEVNSTRFEYRYHSYLDLLSSLFPNALAIHLAAQSGDWSGVKDENKPELSADYLDKLLDLDHFIKDYRNEDWGDDLDDDTKAKIAQLFQTACVFYNEDTIGQSLPDYGDTKISADNGSDQITWGGTKYVMSGMDARYSDMKVATADPTADESEWQESNAFSTNKVSIANLTAMSRMIAEALDLNNDGVVGTDDAVLVLNLYASALNDNSNNWSNYIDLGNNDSTTFDKYQSPYSNCSKNILHIDNLDGVTKNYANDSTLNDSLSEDRFFNFYNYSFDNIITTADSQTYTFNNFFHELNTDEGTTVENKLNFLCAVASRNTSFNLEDDNNNQIPLSTTITVGNTTKTLAEVFYSIASEWNSVFSKMANRSLKSSELATAMLTIIFKYGDPDKGYASVMELASHLEGLYESSITDLYTFDNWQDYYKTATYDGDNVVDTKGWNESVNDLYDFMKEYFENNGLDPTKFNTPKAWLQALKEANAKGTAAGHYLDPTPLVNLFNEIYKEERSDEIKMNVHNMDYTNEGDELGTGAGVNSEGESYNYGELIAYVVNLLMPQYRRRVEVEDLNKNFWVISQVLSILLNQVFGDDGLEAILKGHMAEIMELWNNVKYLWNVIDAQGKMINDLALALKASKQPDVPETEFYRDVYQYKSDSTVNTTIKDTQFNWTGAMWDFNGDGYINGYEPETILKTSGLYENNDKIRFIGTNGETYTISPASIEGFKDLYELKYTNSGSTRNISFNWFFNMNTRAYWINADTSEPEAVNYTIDGPDPSQHPRFNPLTPETNYLFSNGNLQNSIGRLYSVDGDKWISDTQRTGGSYSLNVDFSSASTNNNYLGDIMSGVCRLCFVNVDNLYGKNEQEMNTFVQPSIIASESGVRQVFEFTEYEHLRPILHGGADSFWSDWTTSSDWKSAYNSNKEQIYTTFLNALVFQDYSGTREGFWSYPNNITDATNKIFKNKFLCSLNFNSNGTANGLYMLCAIAPSSIIYTKGDKSKIVLKDLSEDGTYNNYSYQSSESNTNRFYGLYPVCIDNYLIEGLENDIVETGEVNVNNEHTHQLINCVYRSITADDDTYGKGISIRRQVALNILKKMTILASLESTEGYMKTLNPEDATALENIVKNNSVTSPIGRGLPVENMFEASMAGSVILSETEIKINGKNDSIILAGLVDEEQSTLSEVVAINQHFKIKERPLRIWSKDGATIDRVEHIRPTFSRDRDSVSFEVSYTNYPIYSSEKLLDSYEDNEVSIWGGMSSSLNTWFPQYAVGQNFIPNQYSDSLNFVCETSIAERLHQLNTYHEAESTTDSDDSYYISFEINDNTYTTSSSPSSEDNFSIAYPQAEYGIKVKG